VQTSIVSADLCRLIGLAPTLEEAPGTWQFALRRVATGDVLFRQGDVVRNLYVVRSGFFKSYYVRGAAEHVTAFSMTGDVLGMEGIGPNVHFVEAGALTDSEVATVPYALLARTDGEPAFSAQVLLTLLSRENARKCAMVSLLGYSSATARVAAFLLSQGDAFARLGYSRSSLILPMRNIDIGSYLGLRGETVCRAFAVLKAQGLIERQLRSFVIKDEAGLRAVTEADHRPVSSEQRVRSVRRPRPSFARELSAWRS
jgi:CRP/FNR family transcriptional regulator